jgi:hypothetical protein
VTRYNLPPADDPSSIESFLRVRRSQLPGGRPPIRGTREAAERQSAEHDGERIVDLLRRMPVEEYIPAADAGPEALEAAQYDWLRRHGLERGRVDAALGALRDDLNSRVHPPADPAVTAGGGPGGGQVPPQSRPSPAVTELRRDRLGMWRNIQEARRRGLDPAALWPGQAGLPGKPSATGLTAVLAANYSPGSKPGPTGGANSFNTVSGPRAGARPGRPGTGGRAERVVPATSADRPASRASGRRRS